MFPCKTTTGITKSPVCVLVRHGGNVSYIAVVISRTVEIISRSWVNVGRRLRWRLIINSTLGLLDRIIVNHVTSYRPTVIYASSHLRHMNWWLMVTANLAKVMHI